MHGVGPIQSNPAGGEFEVIERWCAQFPTTGEHVAVGPGDDAAWLHGNPQLAISTDSFLEGVHFRRNWGDGVAVGRRALAAALSDLAASRARPVACVIAISSPSWDAYADSVMAGVASAATEWTCPVVGGDSTRSESGLILNITVFGTPTGPGPLLRSGAQVGDVVQISGLPGATSRAVERLLQGERVAWPEVRPRFDLLGVLAKAHAGIDISDGLLADAEQLATASGLGITFDPDPLWDRHVLCGGEDYELLVTAAELLPGFTAIGRVTAGQGLSYSDGSPLPARPWGFVHNAEDKE
jgi:thiamine-monophosphate kinase